MPLYAVFGGLLESEIAFDGLHPTYAAAPTWTFRVDHSAPPLEDAAQIGHEQISADLSITLSRLRDGGVRLSYSAYGLGDFRISADGSRITWHPGADPWLAALRWVLLGRVLATAMYVQGMLCLHGSAVAVQGQGVCFLAPKFHGKSTLAAAMVGAGARLASDDVVPTEVGRQVLMHPGVPVLRLMEDSESIVALAGHGRRRVAADVGKTRLDFSAASDVVTEPQPLSAIYVLAPTSAEPEAGRAAVRTCVTGVTALQLVVRHASIAPLLSPSAARLLFVQGAAIAERVPIYVLRSIRDLTRLDEIVAQLFAWHGARPASMPLAGAVGR